MDASIDELVQEVRREIDEITLPGERVPSDSDLENRASSNISDNAIKDRLMDGTRDVVSRVKGTHLSAFVITVTPSDFDPPYDGSTPSIVRLLGSTVKAEDSNQNMVEATRQLEAELDAGEIDVENPLPTA